MWLGNQTGDSFVNASGVLGRELHRKLHPHPRGTGGCKKNTATAAPLAVFRN
jgi:hypothetical protein